MNSLLPHTNPICNLRKNPKLNRKTLSAIFLSFCGALIFSLLITGSARAQKTPPGTKTRSVSKRTTVTVSRPLANLGLVIKVGQDGLAQLNTVADMLNGRNICPSDPFPGCDFDLHNSIVRTNDQIIYTYDYSVNAGDEPDVTITAAAPFGSVWSPILPAFCFMPDSSVNNGDGTNTQSVITCHRGPKTSGTAESLPFTATVLGTVLNGTVINASGLVTGGGGSTSSPAFGGAPNVIVSAAPRYNLRKELLSTSGSDATGYNVNYLATIGIFDDSSPASLDPRYGSSILTNSISFTDAVSGVSPKAQLTSCGIQNNFGASPSLSIMCSQAGGPGTPISASVSNADSSLRQYSTPQNLYGVGAFTISVFISVSEITSGGHNINDVLTNFDPLSPSPANQTNFSTFGENTNDNGVAVTVVDPGPPQPGNGFFKKSFVREYNNPNPFVLDTFVAPGETFASQVFFVNNTFATLNHVVLCDVMDNTKYQVVPTTVMGTTVHDFNGSPPTAIEFASGYINPSTWLPTGNGGNPSGIRTECADNGVQWNTDPTMVPGGISAITKFRVRLDSMPANDSISLRVRVKARDTDPSAQTIPAGTALSNFGIWRSDEKNPLYIDNDYYQGTYPGNSSGNNDLGARINLARAIVRISKETENNNAANSIETGSPNGIGFVLKPTITTMGPSTPVQVKVIDVLPFGLHYVGGSSSIPSPQPVQTACTAANVPYSSCTSTGQEILTWTLNPDPTPNMPIAPITFRATADLNVLNNQTLTNTAIVQSPADPEIEALRRSTRNVIGASPSTFLIYKQTSTPQIDTGGNFSYAVSYRNASFQTDFTGMDFIDVLPFNGDGALPFGAGTHTRTPPTAFSGSRSLLSSLTGPVGATWYFTDHTPSGSINLNPKDAGNLNPGGVGSIWCAGDVNGPFAGCGFGLGAVTAVRMQDNMVMPRNNTIRTFILSFSTTGNQTNDIYTNNSGGSVNEIVLPVSSVNVPVIVREGKISGLVWYDTDGDGIRDPEEIGRVPNSQVTLTGPANRTTLTDAAGNYSFNGLPGGAYTVKFTRPINYRISPQDQGGDDGLDSDGDGTTLIANVPALGAAGVGTVDQGFYQLNLRGTVWNDGNPDGIQGGIGEGAITTPIFDLELIDNQDIVVRKTQTTGGDYVFVNLPAGDYKVRMSTNSIPVSPVFFPNPNDDVDRDNNGMQETVNSLISNTITLEPGAEPDINHVNGTTLNKTLDFGLFVQPTSAGVAVGGKVVTSDGRGIGRARITLTDSTGATRIAITNPFGYYRFDNIAAGSTVVLSVSSKSYSFEVGTLIVPVGDALSNVDFVAIE